MGALKNHPDWPEYLKKCYALRDEQIAAEDKIMAQYPLSGKSPREAHAAALRIEAIRRQFNAKLRQLQQEYSYLFPKDNQTTTDSARDEKEGK